jgi:hypothetical protein
MILYLEGLTLEEICKQNDYPYELIMKSGITKKAIIENMINKQKAWTKSLMS